MNPTRSAHEVLATTDCAQPGCTREATSNGHCDHHQRKAPMPSLEELIDQQISLGNSDPHELYGLLERQLGDELVEIVKPYIADFISEMGRQRINSKRRAEVAKISPTNSKSREILLRSLWVPDSGIGITYKRIADMTADDFESRAAYLERMAAGVMNHAQWCRDCAEQIRTEGVKTAGKLKQLPELHDLNA